MKCTVSFIQALGFVAVLMSIAACGGGSGGGADDDDDVHVDGGQGTPDGHSISDLDPGDCAGFGANAATADQTCGSPFPGTAGEYEQACRKGIASANLCGGNPAAGLACFVTPDASDWQCGFQAAMPSCNNDINAALGMYCLVALGNLNCASLACEFSTDCPGNAQCNDVTHKCFSNSAYCVGLPCAFSTDCPSGETCNGAVGACIRQ